MRRLRKSQIESKAAEKSRLLLCGSGRNCTAVQQIRCAHVYKLSRLLTFALASPRDMVQPLLVDFVLFPSYRHSRASTLSFMTPASPSNREMMSERLATYALATSRRLIRRRRQESYCWHLIWCLGFLNAATFCGLQYGISLRCRV